MNDPFLAALGICKRAGKLSFGFDVKCVFGTVFAVVREDGIVEGIEHATHPFCIGVQWHPEHMVRYSKQQRRIFEAFVKACKR